MGSYQYSILFTQYSAHGKYSRSLAHETLIFQFFLDESHFATKLELQLKKFVSPIYDSSKTHVKFFFVDYEFLGQNDWNYYLKLMVPVKMLTGTVGRTKFEKMRVESLNGRTLSLFVRYFFGHSDTCSYSVPLCFRGLNINHPLTGKCFYVYSCSSFQFYHSSYYKACNSSVIVRPFLWFQWFYTQRASWSRELRTD